MRLSDDIIERLTLRANGVERIVRCHVVPGLLIRVGARKRSFGLRIERSGRAAVYKTLGAWPDMTLAEARSAAHDVLAGYERRLPVSPGTGHAARHAEATIATVLPLYEERLRDRGASPATIGWYREATNRLSAGFKEIPLTALGADPVLVDDEIRRLRRERIGSRRAGGSAATSTARAVRTLFRFAQKRDPNLRGDPTSACETIDPRRYDLPVLAEREMEQWFVAVQALRKTHHIEAHLFCLLSGLRAGSLTTLEWQHLDLRRRCIRVEHVKGGAGRAFDLPLSRAMLRCLWRARRTGRRLYPMEGGRWVFPGSTGHVRADSLTKDGVLANHALRRAFATIATAAGVDEDTIGKLLNHGGRSITSRYVKTSYLGRMLAEAQEDISQHIVRALRNPQK